MDTEIPVKAPTLILWLVLEIVLLPVIIPCFAVWLVLQWLPWLWERGKNSYRGTRQ